MTFDILTPLTLLDGTVPSGTDTLIPDLVAPAVPNVDALGGTLTLADDFDPLNRDGTVSMKYTAADGTVSETTLTMPEGYYAAGFESPYVGSGAILPQPVVFGAALDTFLLPISNETTPGFLQIGIGADGTASVLLTDTTTLETGFTTPLTGVAMFMPLGDGRVAFAIDSQSSFGTLTDDEGTIVSDGLFASGNDGWLGHFIATQDGGTVGIFQNTSVGLDLQYEVVQFDEFGNSIAAETYNNIDVVAAGLGADTTQTFVQLTLEGELQFVFSGDVDGVPVAYEKVIDLKPDADLVTTPATENDDVLVLGDADDVVDGLGGNDSLYGGDGQDFLSGGAGDDLIDGGADDDSITDSYFAGTTDDVVRIGGLYGGDGDDSINGREGTDFLDGGAGNDDLRGGTGDDTGWDSGSGARGGLFGGDGDDFMRGNLGNDELRGDGGADDINGGFGDDVLYGDDDDDKLAGFDGNDTVYGGTGRDMMHGGRGDDRMLGDEGDDILRGADGLDYLEGGEGDDLLIGGDGADVFAYDVGERTIASSDLVSTNDNGTDTIKDFAIGEDKILINAGLADYTFDDEDPSAPPRPTLTFDDIFLSQEDSVAVIEAGETVIRLEGVNIDDLDETDFMF